jgi:hypothetical protein
MYINLSFQIENCLKSFENEMLDNKNTKELNLLKIKQIRSSMN